MLQLVRYAESGDAVVLYEDAVIAAQCNSQYLAEITRWRAAGIAVYVLQPDCALRGIEPDISQVIGIDYSGFVELVEQHEQQMSL